MALFRKKAKHFELSTSNSEVRRGDEVEATLTIKDAAEVGEKLEVGLLCSELYDERTESTDADGRPTANRSTVEATAFENWLPASPSERLQTFKFRIPKDAPFSHRGSCLSFAWRVSAREPRRMRRDPTTGQELQVLP